MNKNVVNLVLGVVGAIAIIIIGFFVYSYFVNKPAVVASAPKQDVAVVKQAIPPAAPATPPDMNIGTLFAKDVKVEKDIEVPKIKVTKKIKTPKIVVEKEITTPKVVAEKVETKLLEAEKIKAKELEVELAKIRLAEIEKAKIKLAEIEEANIELARIKLAEIEKAKIKLAEVELARVKKVEIEKAANVGKKSGAGKECKEGEECGNRNTNPKWSYKSKDSYGGVTVIYGQNNAVSGTWIQSKWFVPGKETQIVVTNWDGKSNISQRLVAAQAEAKRTEQRIRSGQLAYTCGQNHCYVCEF